MFCKFSGARDLSCDWLSLLYSSTSTSPQSHFSCVRCHWNGYGHFGDPVKGKIKSQDTISGGQGYADVVFSHFSRQWSYYWASWSRSDFQKYCSGLLADSPCAVMLEARMRGHIGHDYVLWYTEPEGISLKCASPEASLRRILPIRMQLLYLPKAEWVQGKQEDIMIQVIKKEALSWNSLEGRRGLRTAHSEESWYLRCVCRKWEKNEAICDPNYQLINKKHL